MPHPFETRVADATANLRNEAITASAVSDASICDGFSISWDKDEGRVAVHIESTPNTLMHIATQVTKTPRWFSLNCVMGDGVIEAGDVLGLVIEAKCDRALTIPVFVRSGNADSFVDTALDRGLRIPARQATNTLLHTVQPHEPFTDEIAFHTLVLPLPSDDLTLDLLDLRVFVLPKARVPNVAVSNIFELTR